MRMTYPTSHHCICGCGQLVSRKGCRTNVCHGKHINTLRTPEQKKRIGQRASKAAVASRVQAKSLSQTTWSPTSGLL